MHYTGITKNKIKHLLEKTTAVASLTGCPDCWLQTAHTINCKDHQSKRLALIFYQCL